MMIYDRKTKTYTEIEQYGGKALAFLYGNPFGRILLRLAVSPLVSNIYAFFNSGEKSAGKIPGFISEYSIDMSDYETKDYCSFNDFFIRKFRDGARSMDPDPKAFISPADSKLLVYKIDGSRLQIKGRTYSISELVGDGFKADAFRDGYALCFRLCMDNCHRYCYVDNGRLIRTETIKGRLHTVSSISKEYKIYKENTRVISLLRTENFGDIIQAEVGALLVGRIHNDDNQIFKKGQEKGYFEPGGSTIIILVAKDMLSIDEDILAQSENGIETQIHYGERIGCKIC